MRPEDHTTNQLAYFMAENKDHRIINIWKRILTTNVALIQHHQNISPSIILTGFLNSSRDSDSTISLGSLFKHLAKPFSEEIIRHIQSKSPLVQFEAIYSHCISSYLGKESDPLLVTNSSVRVANQAGQAAPAFHKPVLAKPDPLVVLHMCHVMALKII